MKKLKPSFWFYLFISLGNWFALELVVLFFIGYACAILKSCSPLIFLIFSSFKVKYLLILLILLTVLIGPVVVIYITRIRFSRVSNNMVYCWHRHTLHMNIRFIWRYWKINYINDRPEVEKLLNKEFIEGLESLSKGINPQKFTVDTHRLIYLNIKRSPEVQQLYHVKVIGGSQGKGPKSQKIMAAAILSLMPPTYIFRHKAEVKKLSMKEKIAYTLEFTRIDK